MIKINVRVNIRHLTKYLVILVLWQSPPAKVQAQVNPTIQPQKTAASPLLLDYLKSKLIKYPADYYNRLSKYFTTIGLTSDKPFYQNEVLRILTSSTQYILCKDMDDWVCLEKKPSIKISVENRSDISDTLGTPVNAGESLKLEYYFTQGWFDNMGVSPDKYVAPQYPLASVLADKINNYGEKNIWLAIYGLDDTEGSLKSVYQALQNKVESGVSVYSVVDVSQEHNGNSFIRNYNIIRKSDGTYGVSDQLLPMDFSYVYKQDDSKSVFNPPIWLNQYLQDLQINMQTSNVEQNQFQIEKIVSEKLFNFPEPVVARNKLLLADLVWLGVNANLPALQESIAKITFQYGDTLKWVKYLNSKATRNADARVHLEWPFQNIMHNKFFVFEKANGQKSVWTGTANVSKTCMGTEENSNLAVFIQNNAIAEAYQTEFNEMYNPVRNSGQPETLLTGSFHRNKKANTQRYFKFNDGTEVKVHFSPTDDAEHRSILPMIYSANPGDILRVSMFGGGGFEIVRALQYAAAKGVDVRIVLDKLTGSSSGSWWKSKPANLLEKNFFTDNPKGKLQLRVNQWNGLNHQKVASLTRRRSVAGGVIQMRAEVIALGSQNWSRTGNDDNDENMLTIRNRNRELEIIKAFNQEFDQKIWPSTAAAL